jgi:hypothetical protein
MVSADDRSLSTGQTIPQYLGDGWLAVLVTPQTGKSMWQIRLELLPEGSKIVLGVMSPLFCGGRAS